MELGDGGVRLWATCHLQIASEKDIRTHEGLELFLNDWHSAWTYLARRAFGKWHDE
jgi:hypothetical protein